MPLNLCLADRIIRAVAGAVALVAGLALGRLAWWGLVLDAAGALLLLSARLGFCHVYKAFGISSARQR